MSKVAIGIAVATSAAARAAIAILFVVLAVPEFCSAKVAAVRAMFLVLRDITLASSARLTAMKRAVVHNATVLGAMLEDMATAYLAGDGTELSPCATMANAQRRLLCDLGLERRAQDITPDLQSYIRHKGQAA